MSKPHDITGCTDCYMNHEDKDLVPTTLDCRCCVNGCSNGSDSDESLQNLSVTIKNCDDGAMFEEMYTTNESFNRDAKQIESTCEGDIFSGGNKGLGNILLLIAFIAVGVAICVTLAKTVGKLRTTWIFRFSFSMAIIISLFIFNTFKNSGIPILVTIVIYGIIPLIVIYIIPYMKRRGNIEPSVPEPSIGNRTVIETGYRVGT